MRLLGPIAAAAALAASAPAAAQVSNHGISVESGISSALRGRAGPSATFALSASTWLDGDLEGVARLAYASAGGTGGRAAAGAMGTLGLRLSLGRAPLRPQVLAEAGWARVGAGPDAAGRAAFAVGAALEWFAAPELSVAPRAVLRALAGDAALELTLALGGYF